MTELIRSFGLDGGIVNMETGEFPMTLATEGEASDGHILGIRGADLPESVPMLFAHKDSEVMIPSLGTVHSMRKEQRGDIFAMPAIGHFNLKGDGMLADIRRDMAQLANNGDLPSASARWTGEAVSRSSLPRDHQFHNARGLFFESPIFKEGSLLAIGADSKALLGRADNADNASQKLFWQVLARTEANQEGQREVSLAFQALYTAMDGLTAVGCTPDDAIRSIGIDQSETLFKYKGVMLPASLYQSITDLERSHLELLLMRDDELARKSESQDVVTRESDDEDTARKSVPEVLEPERNLESVLAEIRPRLGAITQEGERLAKYKVLGQRA